MNLTQIYSISSSLTQSKPEQSGWWYMQCGDCVVIIELANQLMEVMKDLVPTYYATWFNNSTRVIMVRADIVKIELQFISRKMKKESRRFIFHILANAWHDKWAVQWANLSESYFVAVTIMVYTPGGARNDGLGN